MANIEFTPEALDHVTSDQREKLVYLAEGSSVNKIAVSKAGLDLPAGYIAVRIDYHSSGSIYGGIDPEGTLST